MNLNEFYSVFDKVQENREQVEKYIHSYNLKRKELKEYLIAFTPRSGSSWLNELLTQTKVAGNPEEWFNHEHLPDILRTYQCSNIQDYIQCIKSDQSTANGCFGIEATFFQLRLVLQACNFEDLLKEPKVIYLIRKDFVSQGISLYKAVETGYFHSTQKKEKADLAYDAEKIKYWILHILQQESYWEQFFTEKNLFPLRLTYEELVHNSSAVLRRVFWHLDLSNVEADFSQKTLHRIVSDETNQKFRQLFCEQMNEFIEICKMNRGSPNLLKLES